MNTNCIASMKSKGEGLQMLSSPGLGLETSSRQDKALGVYEFKAERMK